MFVRYLELKPLMWRSVMSDNKEAVFQSWLIEFQNQLWLNSKVIPESVFDALQDYKHFSMHLNQTDALKKINQAGDTFKELTGYDILDFIRYEDIQNTKLQDRKK
jgi:hypothetical protein